jgi:transglutaminase-like putative cysteine protease
MLWEWLKPLPAFAPFDDLSVFVLLSAILVCLSVIGWPRLFTVLLKFTASAGVVYYLYLRDLESNNERKTFLEEEFLINKEFILQQEWLQATAFGRTLVFILLLWIVVSVICHAVIKNNQGVWYGMVTCVYFVLLDITTLYDVKWALVRSVAYALILLSLLQLRFIERRGVTFGNSSRNRVYWVSSSLILVLIMTSIAYAVPKPGESEMLSFSAFGVGANGQGGPKRVGYESGNAKLGGPFLEDETVVFHALSTEKHYWRGQSKQTYTGQEWRGEPDRLSELPIGQDLDNPLLFENIKTEEFSASVAFTEAKYQTLFVGGQLNKVITIGPDNGNVYSMSNDDIEISYPQIGQYIEEYSVIAENPLINEELLQKSTTDYHPAIRQAYLQLPQSLPERVVQLAEQLTQNANDPYSKAVVIQNHLRYMGGYRYEREDVPYVLEQQDFVDQFLFESKQGYCDHFSSSMVVLLRSVGIPARYVKGFSTGEMSVLEDSDTYKVTMRNRNAHSWAEVYFEGYGWIPFEPTPGFVHPTKRDAEANQQDQNEVPVSAPVPPIPQITPESDETSIEESSAPLETKSVDFWMVAILAVIFVLSAGFLWKDKNKIGFWLLHKRGQQIRHVNGVYSTYLSLLSLLGRRFTRRKSSETLEEFVSRLSLAGESKTELTKLTTWYEKQIYGRRNNDKQSWKEPKDVLVRLLRYFIS